MAGRRPFMRTPMGHPGIFRPRWDDLAEQLHAEQARRAAGEPEPEPEPERQARRKRGKRGRRR